MIGEWYPTLKSIHVGAVTLSGGLFVLRAGWMLLDSQRLGARWVRVVPHVVDTVLLVSAVLLMLALRQYPLVHAWLTAKVVALCVYIVLGSVALKRGRTKSIRVVALAAAVTTFGYIVSVALSRHPLGFLAA